MRKETIDLRFQLLSMAPSDMCNAKKYPKDGLYIVDDSIAHFLVSVANDGVASITIPNRGIIDEYVKTIKEACTKSQDDMTKRDIEARRKLANEFEELNTTMGHVLNAINKLEADLSPVPQSNIDLAAITKMIAVIQKSNLIKDK